MTYIWYCFWGAGVSSGGVCLFFLSMHMLHVYVFSCDHTSCMEKSMSQVRRVDPNAETYISNA